MYNAAASTAAIRQSNCAVPFRRKRCRSFSTKNLQDCCCSFSEKKMPWFQHQKPSGLHGGICARRLPALMPLRAKAQHARACPSALPMIWVSPAPAEPPGLASERLFAELRRQLPCWCLADPGVNFPRCGYFAGNWETHSPRNFNRNRCTCLREQ